MCTVGAFGLVAAFDPSSARFSLSGKAVERSFVSHVELKEAPCSFVAPSRGASRTQLKLKTRCPIVGQESNLLAANMHEWEKHRPGDG